MLCAPPMKWGLNGGCMQPLVEGGLHAIPALGGCRGVVCNSCERLAAGESFKKCHEKR